MNYQESIETHYPVTVLTRTFSNNNELNSKLLNNILELEKQSIQNNNNAVNSGVITTEGGYQTPLNFNYFEQNVDAVKALKKDFLEPAIKQYLSTVFSEQSKQIEPWIVGWANILRENNWQRPHFHPTQKNIISGVYYVKLPENLNEPEGAIEFINPIPISVHHGYSNTRRIAPREGMLLLFPPYYMHYVHPVLSKEHRAVIAFDVLLESPKIKFVF